MESYLYNRGFKVNVGWEHILTENINTGVPQESILANLVFNIYISDISKLEPCSIAQYANDTAIYSKSWVFTKIKKNLDKNMNTLKFWFKKWKLQMNTQKTVAIFFT